VGGGGEAKGLARQLSSMIDRFKSSHPFPVNGRLTKVMFESGSTFMSQISMHVSGSENQLFYSLTSYIKMF
jgi:hypothetical protein